MQQQSRHSHPAHTRSSRRVKQWPKSEDFFDVGWQKIVCAGRARLSAPLTGPPIWTPPCCILFTTTVLDHFYATVHLQFSYQSCPFFLKPSFSLFGISGNFYSLTARWWFRYHHRSSLPTCRWEALHSPACVCRVVRKTADRRRKGTPDLPVNYQRLALVMKTNFQNCQVPRLMDCWRSTKHRIGCSI